MGIFSSQNTGLSRIVLDQDSDQGLYWTNLKALQMILALYSHPVQIDDMQTVQLVAEHLSDDHGEEGEGAKDQAAGAVHYTLGSWALVSVPSGNLLEIFQHQFRTLFPNLSEVSILAGRIHRVGALLQILHNVAGLPGYKVLLAIGSDVLEALCSAGQTG